MKCQSLPFRHGMAYGHGKAAAQCREGGRRNKSTTSAMPTTAVPTTAVSTAMSTTRALRKRGCTRGVGAGRGRGSSAALERGGGGGALVLSSLTSHNPGRSPYMLLCRWTQLHAPGHNTPASMEDTNRLSTHLEGKTCLARPSQSYHR